MRRLVLTVVLCSALSACGGAEPRWSPDAAVSKARYVDDGPKALTLYTVVNKKNGSGAHSGLMINGSQRVIFDPAGTWYLPRLAERNDVHFGMDDRMVNFYIDYHARETYDVIEQTVEVSPQVAETALQLALANGAVPKAQCTNSISNLLRQVPGFENVQKTWFPNKLAESFAQLPGVTRRTITDDDADNNHGVLMVQLGDPRVAEAEAAVMAADAANAAAAAELTAAAAGQ